MLWSPLFMLYGRRIWKCVNFIWNVHIQCVIISWTNLINQKWFQGYSICITYTWFPGSCFYTQYELWLKIDIYLCLYINHKCIYIYNIKGHISIRFIYVDLRFEILKDFWMRLDFFFFSQLLYCPPPPPKEKVGPGQEYSRTYLNFTLIKDSTL